MAAFTDQFDRQNPLEFSPSLTILGTWPLQIATEAKNLLKGRTLSEVKAIATAVDSVILEGVRKAMLTHPDFEPSDIQSGLVTLEDLPQECVNTIRLEYGDLALFNAAGGYKGIAQSSFRPDFKFHDHQAFAAFSLWKLLDAFDSLTRVYGVGSDGKMKFDSLAPSTIYYAFDIGAGAVIEASTACATAAQLRVQAETVKAFHETTNETFLARLAEDVQRRTEEKSVQTSAAAKERWKDRDRHREMAVSFAVARPFRTRAEAARQTQKFLQETAGGDVYTVKTVDDWLAADGWKKAG